MRRKGNINKFTWLILAVAGIIHFQQYLNSLEGIESVDSLPLIGGGKGALSAKYQNSWALDQSQDIYENQILIDGTSKALFVGTYGDVWSIDRITGNMSKREGNAWIEQDAPETMGGYNVVMSSANLTAEQIAKIISEGGDIAKIITDLEEAEKEKKSAEEALEDSTESELTPEEIAIEERKKADAIKKGINYIGAITQENDIIFSRIGITDKNPKGKDWQQVADNTALPELPGSVQQMSVTGLGRVWATNESNQALFKPSLSDEDDWESVDGEFKQIVANNKDHVWGIDINNKVYIRTGGSIVDPSGSYWSELPGAELQNITINDNNQLWGVHPDGSMYMRTGIDDNNLSGTAWEQIPFTKQFRQVSINNHGHIWAIAADNQIYFRKGISDVTPAGTSWENIAGELKQIVVVNRGIWGIDTNNRIFFREGVTKETPVGTGWSVPLKGSFETIFASGVELRKPNFSASEKALNKKKKARRIKKLKKRLKKLKKKLKKTKGKKKKKLKKKIKKLSKKIKKLKKKGKGKKKKLKKKKKKKGKKKKLKKKKKGKKKKLKRKNKGKKKKLRKKKKKKGKKKKLKKKKKKKLKKKKKKKLRKKKKKKGKKKKKKKKDKEKEER
jgi:hypothetical protein